MLTSSYIESENVMTLLNKNNETVTMTESENEKLDLVFQANASKSVEHLTLLACRDAKDFIDRNFNDQIDALKFFQEVVEIEHIARMYANINTRATIETHIDIDEFDDLHDIRACDIDFYDAAQDAIHSAVQQEVDFLEETSDEVFIVSRIFLNKSKFKIAA